jgi:hypothetical protein
MPDPGRCSLAAEPLWGDKPGLLIQDIAALALGR